ncbi:phosphodiesterase [Pseudoalteromonas phenolica]|uniref:Phosphodiesterase n=1 Tax=Pseudoalteromonas phenolica TaxID=161398 RepID=A0A5S3YWE4_9GAMM|nr:HD-GYP domain-containing protein [Pseudoalteromonas phenolica]TMP81495.1 phosphodiesterase [Pseudoalteromonas phenolica]
MKSISIEELQPGMFVVSVLEQTGSVQVKTQGWVKTQTSINKLASAGILRVEVDPDKMLDLNNNKHGITASDSDIESAPEQEKDPWHKSTAISAEINQAMRLVEEAKSLQAKAFADLKAGNPIDVDSFKEVATSFIDSIFRNQDALSCIAMIKQKDAYLLEHSINVATLITIFAKHLRLDREIIEELATGALLHDIGKIKVDDAVLNKPGKLSDNEFEHMKQHAQFSYDIVTEAGLSEISCEVAGFHHERLDGSGYPNGLSNNEISQFVRMASIVDVFDALTAERVYKKALTPIQAFKILRENSPQHYDEKLLNEFINCIGLYPVGSLVKLKSQRIGMVVSSNPEQPLRPIVKVFYSAKSMYHIAVEDIDLAEKRCTDELEAAVKPEEFGLDLIKFFKHSVLP